MKRMTWLHYMRASNLDPATCVAGSKLLHSHLQAMFNRHGITEYDMDMRNANIIFSDAWESLNKGDVLTAFNKATFGLTKIVGFAFDERFSTIDVLSFKGSVK